MSILITGATGNVGRRVAELLSARGVETRRLVRDPDRAPALAGSSVFAGDYQDRVALGRALQSVETVFLVSGSAPPLKRAALHGTVIDAAVEAGVKRVVYLSFQGASATSPFPYSADHLLSEAHLGQSGLAFTILRDSFYLDLLPELADASGVIRGPAGEGKVAWVSRENVAQVAAAVLTNSGHDGRTYDVTGPEAFSLREAARRLSVISRIPVTFVEETVEAGRAWRARTGAAAWEVDVWLGSYLAMASGELSIPSDTVWRITGQLPYRLEAYFAAFPQQLGALERRQEA
jgi:NAD(P)H dehydrogenase (quinone)